MAHNSTAKLTNRAGFALILVAFGATVSGAATAPIDLGAAGPKNWALLGLGGPTTLTMSGGSVVNGAVPNVGMAATGNLQLSGGSTISGKAYINAAGRAQVTGQSVITGGTVQNADTLLNQAVQDALATSTRMAGLAATIPTPTNVNIGSPAQNLTITGTSGVNVLKLTDLILSNGTLTLTAPPGGVFIVNISGRFVLSNQSQIVLGATVTPLAVAYNITGAGQDVTIGDKSPVTGILLAPRRNVLLSSALIFVGEIIAGGPTLSLSGGAQVTNPYLPPTITSSSAPPPNAAGWNNANVTVSFTCADAIAGIYICPPPVVVTTDGANQVISGMVIDNTGGTASASSIVNLDKTPPQITSKVMPTPNGAGWNNVNPTVTFTCMDATSGVTSCSPPVIVTAETAGQIVTGTATDKAVNTATTSVTVKLDKTPPTGAITSPATGATVFTSPVAVGGTVADGLSGVAGVTCNGAAATLAGASFNCGVSLTPGTNTITVRVTDVAGNSTNLPTISLTYAQAPTVTFTAPTNLSYLNITPTTVTGTVSDPTATVVINSVPTVVANGQFSIALPLAEGPNIITATATSAAGAVGTSSIQVTLDTMPPHVTITSPPDKFVTTDTSVSVAGNINDIVVGTVNAQQAQVTVNGIAAQVANRTFLATNVPLNTGDNVIQAVGRDAAGNAATTQITVTRQAPSPSQIHLISGNNQAGTIGSVLASPLVIALSDASGNPAPNKPVIFRVTQDDGMVSAGGASAASLVATTDAQGQAQVQWTLGQRAGAGGNVVEAYSVGFGGTAVFTATGNQGPAGKIVIDTGNNQVGAINQPLPKPLIAVVVDAGNNRLANVPVTFTVKQGGGGLGAQGSASFTLSQGSANFVGQTSVTVNSDSDGRVAAILTLGFQEGDANNLVEANFTGNQGFPATFTASGRAPGDPFETMISGVVLDNSDVPIPGVTIRAVLTNLINSNSTSVQTAADVQTNAQGQFIIPQAPVGFVKLLVDGSTAQLPGTYPALDYDLVTVAGQNNTVGTPIYLLPLNAANKLCVTATTGGGTLTIPEAPGFSLTFGPGQVTFPGGSQSGCVSVTAVHGDKVPMTPGFGQQPRFIVTIQPAGALFNPPAPITLPNVDGLKPREVTEMYSFDHDIGSFVAIGTGTVSDDGQVIRSSAGVGVLKAGWHCGGNPGSSGVAATCPVCFFCPGSLANCQPQGNGTPCGNGGTCQFGRGCVGGGGCSAGFTLNAAGQCCQGTTCTPPSCPQGQTFNPTTGTCVNNGPCAPGYTLNNGQCRVGTSCAPPSCPAGQTFDPATGTCVNSGPCAPGYTLNNGQCCQGNMCVPPSCPSGQTFDPTTGTCVLSMCTPQTAGASCMCGGGGAIGMCSGGQCTVNGRNCGGPNIQLTGLSSEQFPGAGQNSLPGNAGVNPVAQILVMLGARSDGNVYGTATFSVSPSPPTGVALVGGLGTCIAGGGAHVLYPADVTGTMLSFHFVPPLTPVEVVPLMGTDNNGNGVLDDQEVLSNCDPTTTYRFRIVSPIYSDARKLEALASLGIANDAGFVLAADFLHSFLSSYDGDGTESVENVTSLSSLGTLDHNVGLQYDSMTRTFVVPKIIHPSTSPTAQIVRESADISDALTITMNAVKRSTNACSLAVDQQLTVTAVPLQGNVSPTQMQFITSDLLNAIGAANITGQASATMRRTAQGIDVSGIVLNGLVLDLYDWFYVDEYPPLPIRSYLPNFVPFKMVDIQVNYVQSGNGGRVYRNVIDISGSRNGSVALQCP